MGNMVCSFFEKKKPLDIFLLVRVLGAFCVREKVLVVYLFIYLFRYLFIHLFIYLFISSSTQFCP